jgi:hypothetical protein
MLGRLARGALLLVLLSFGVQAQEVPNFSGRYQLGVVHVTVNGVDPATARPVEERKGSAFFITDRRMLSSKHLFVGQDGRRLNQMTIVGRLGSHLGRPFDIVANSSLPRLHAEFDVAMLTTDDPMLGQRALPLCFDQAPQVGHRVVALGFPRGAEYDQTDGTIRSTSPAFAEAWLTNAALNPGNSGGPVLSLGGSVVAIVIGGFRDGSIQGQNAVLPLRVAQQFISDVVAIQQNCASTDPRLGIPSVESVTSQRLVVMADESGGEGSVPRGTETLRRVVAATSEQLRLSRYSIVDEDALRQSLGFGEQRRGQRQELIQAVILANNSANPNQRARFLALIRVVARPERLSFATQIYVRANAEVLDLQTNAIIANREITHPTIPAPLNCDEFCVRERVGAAASLLGTDLAAAIRQTFP